MHPETLFLSDLNEPDAYAIAELIVRIWPKLGKDIAFRKKQLLELGREYTGPPHQAPRSFIIREDSQVVAHAAALPRTIGTDTGELTIVGLSRVCSAPEKRGKRFGEVVVRKVFELVDEAVFPYCLFQNSRKVQPFYEKLGASVIENKIINSFAHNPEEPAFHDELAMVYPSSPSWPQGTIDLRGPGY